MHFLFGLGMVFWLDIDDGAGTKEPKKGVTLEGPGTHREPRESEASSKEYLAPTMMINPYLGDRSFDYDYGCTKSKLYAACIWVWTL